MLLDVVKDIFKYCKKNKSAATRLAMVFVMCAIGVYADYKINSASLRQMVFVINYAVVMYILFKLSVQSYLSKIPYEMNSSGINTLYTEIFNNSPNIYVVVDQNTMTIKDINLGGLQELEYETKDDVVGKQICELFYLDRDTPCGLCVGECRRTSKLIEPPVYVVVGGRKIRKFSGKLVKATNEVIDVSGRAYSFFIGNWGVMCVAMNDITFNIRRNREQEHLLETLKEERRVMELVTNNITEFVIWRVDKDLNIKFMSKSARVLFGINDEDIVGRNLNDILVSGINLKYPPRHIDVGRNERDSSPRKEIIQVVVSGSSDPRYVQIISYMEYDGDTPVGYFGCATDVTSEHKKKKSFDNAASKLKESLNSIASNRKSDELEGIDE